MELNETMEGELSIEKIISSAIETFDVVLAKSENPYDIAGYVRRYAHKAKKDFVPLYYTMGSIAVYGNAAKCINGVVLLSRIEEFQEDILNNLFQMQSKLSDVTRFTVFAIQKNPWPEHRQASLLRDGSLRIARLSCQSESGLR